MISWLQEEQDEHGQGKREVVIASCDIVFHEASDYKTNGDTPTTTNNGNYQIPYKKKTVEMTKHMIL
jgi:hypothetical protein